MGGVDSWDGSVFLHGLGGGVGSGWLRRFVGVWVPWFFAWIMAWGGGGQCGFVVVYLCIAWLTGRSHSPRSLTNVSSRLP